MSQTLPIQLVPQVPPTGLQQPSGLYPLLQIICTYVQASVQQGVAFMSIVAADPATMTTYLVFNSTEGIFKYWSTSSGNYQPVTQYNVGDRKSSFIGGDEIASGWVLLNGRLLTAVPGLSAAQTVNLNALFGNNGSPATVPTNEGIGSFAALPNNGAFSNIPNLQIQPAVGTFSGLTPANPPVQADLVNVDLNCELLLDTANDLQGTVTNVIAQSEAMLEALNGTSQGSGPTVYWKVFVGYP